MKRFFDCIKHRFLCWNLWPKKKRSYSIKVPTHVILHKDGLKLYGKKLNVLSGNRRRFSVNIRIEKLPRYRQNASTSNEKVNVKIKQRYNHWS